MVPVPALVALLPPPLVVLLRCACNVLVCYLLGPLAVGKRTSRLPCSTP